MKAAYPVFVFAALTVVSAGLFTPARAGTPVRHGDSIAVDAGGAGADTPEVKSEAAAQDRNSSRSNKTASSVGTEPCCADTDGDGTADNAKPRELKPQIYKAKQGATGKAK